MLRKDQFILEGGIFSHLPISISHIIISPAFINVRFPFIYVTVHIFSIEMASGGLFDIHFQSFQTFSLLNVYFEKQDFLLLLWNYNVPVGKRKAPWRTLPLGMIVPEIVLFSSHCPPFSHLIKFTKGQRMNVNRTNQTYSVLETQISEQRVYILFMGKLFHHLLIHQSIQILDICEQSIILRKIKLEFFT